MRTNTEKLKREFKRKVGLTPKQYIRIARLNEVNRLLEERDGPANLTTISYEAGYADQAHFIHDFKHFTGKPPGAFLKRRDQFIVNPNATPFSESD